MKSMIAAASTLGAETEVRSRNHDLGPRGLPATSNSTLY
jgi:hypothetical protein